MQLGFQYLQLRTLPVFKYHKFMLFADFFKLSYYVLREILQYVNVSLQYTDVGTHKVSNLLKKHKNYNYSIEV